MLSPPLLAMKDYRLAVLPGGNMLLRRFVLPAVIALSFACAHAQEFSADLVNTKGEPSNSKERATRIYVGKNKIRMENEASSNGGAIIVDGASNTTTILMPERKMYIQSTPDQERMGGFQNITAFMRPADPSNACPQWEAAMANLRDKENKLTSCRKLGNDVVNGRPAVKYEGTSSKGEKGYVWVDPKLRFFLKWEGSEGAAELRNIKEGTQPANLFDIPSDYTKFDMGSMMRNRRGTNKPPQ
jgi:hypothetical protein